MCREKNKPPTGAEGLTFAVGAAIVRLMQRRDNVADRGIRGKTLPLK